MQRELSGVPVLKGGASGEEAQIIINGVNSILRDPTPVFVVDGIMVDNISFVSPSLIQRVRVVKGGSVYGSRGSNGAIEIETTVNN